MSIVQDNNIMEDFMKNMQKYEQLAITEVDAYLFGQGTHYEIYNKMGAHVGVKDGKSMLQVSLITGMHMVMI